MFKLVTAIYELINGCYYHPVLDKIGLTPDSPMFGFIIDNVCAV